MAVDLEEEDPSAAADSLKTTAISSTLSAATGVVVIDTSNLAYRSSYGNPDLRNARGEFTGHVFGALRSILALLQNHLEAGTWLPVFCYDGAHAKDERRAILPSYKGNRDPNRFNPIPGVELALRMLPGLHVKHPLREGDDALAWVVEKMNRGRRPAVVYSGDKDTWFLLKHRGVSVFSPNLERFVTVEDVLKEFHTTPDRIPLAKAFHGDPSDGVKGVERLIRKVMAPHICHHLSTDVDGVYRRIRYQIADLGSAAYNPDLTQKKTKPQQEAVKEVVKLTKLLAKIEPEYARVCDNFRVVTANTTGFTAEHVRGGWGDKAGLKAALEYMDCKTLLERLDDFFGAEMYLQHG